MSATKRAKARHLPIPRQYGYGDPLRPLEPASEYAQRVDVGLALDNRGQRVVILTINGATTMRPKTFLLGVDAARQLSQHLGTAATA